jgi:hypothetical protein
LSAVLCAVLLLAPAVATKAYDPASFGARPGGDAAANTAAIQQALDAAAAGGGGKVSFATPGVYDLAAQGPNPYHQGRRYCLELRGNGLTLSIGPDVQLRLAAAQQSNDSGPVDVLIWRARHDITITGGGTISGNTAGQTGWNKRYAQITHGNLIAGYGTEDAHNERIRIDDITLLDHFSNAIYLSALPGSRDRDIRITGVRARDTGEGILVMNADDVVLSANRYENARVAPHPGDGLELWNVVGFKILQSVVRGKLGGSGIDLYGSRDGIVDGFAIEGGLEGVGIQENTALGTYAERIEVRRGTVMLAGPGSGVFTRGARVRHVTFADVSVQGSSQPGTIGFQISMDDADPRPSADWRQQGPVTLQNCSAHGNDVGLLIKTVAGLTVSGGDYSANAASAVSDGVRWMGQANAYRRVDTRDLVIRGVRAIGNKRYGIHIDAQRLVGREPRGSITGCSRSGGGQATTVHVTSVASPDIARDLTFDASCTPVSAAAGPSPGAAPPPAARPSPPPPRPPVAHPASRPAPGARPSPAARPSPRPSPTAP